MPIKHAALSQMRKDRKRAVRNQARLTELKTLRKQLRTLVGEQKRDDAIKLLPQVMRRFDRAASKRLIHPNVASRTKSRLTRLLGRLKSSSK